MQQRAAVKYFFADSLKTARATTERGGTRSCLHFLPPSPPAEKTTARQDQAG